jgi:hypothetical protein
MPCVVEDRRSTRQIWKALARWRVLHRMGLALELKYTQNGALVYASVGEELAAVQGTLVTLEAQVRIRADLT